MRQDYVGMTERARSLRRSETSAEQHMWSLLRARRCGGLRFIRQAPAGQYVLDFFCPEVRLAIEIDGSIHDVLEVQENDKVRQQVLEEELKITFLRLTNEQAFGAEKEVQRIILSAVEAKGKTTPGTGARPARLR